MMVCSVAVVAMVRAKEQRGESGRLLDVLANLAIELELILEKSGENKESCKDCDNEDVNDGIFHNNPATLAFLFRGEQGRANLLGGTQPEEHRRMDGVEVRDQDWNSHNDQEDVSKDEIRAP